MTVDRSGDGAVATGGREDGSADGVLRSVRELEERVERRGEARRAAEERVAEARREAERLMAEAEDRAHGRIARRREELLAEADREAERARRRASERVRALSEAAERCRDELVDELTSLVAGAGEV